ncbi:MAG: hypothetical protein AAF915_08460 [Cyanobacteria bacterium P01_D01_bin.50]
MKQLPRRDMLSALIEKLESETEIDLDRITEQVLWEMYENGCSHFVVRNNEIVGCSVAWHDLRKSAKYTAYVELGTVWVQKPDRASILRELTYNISRIAKENKIMGFCKELKLARFFRQSPMFPVNKIANQKNFPTELLESFSQFKGWSNDDTTQEKYQRVLYHQDDGQITPWYLVYQE